MFDFDLPGKKDITKKTTPKMIQVILAECSQSAHGILSEHTLFMEEISAQKIMPAAFLEQFCEQTGRTIEKYKDEQKLLRTAFKMFKKAKEEAVLESVNISSLEL